MLKLPNKLQNRLKKWALNKLLEDIGVDLSPEPEIWAELNRTEEENILSRIWRDKLLLSLLKKYAEIANKNMVTKSVVDQQFWKHQGVFVFILKLLARAKKANQRIYENRESDDKGQ